MQKDSNEILFNKKSSKGLVKKNAQDAKKIIQLLNEYASHENKVPEVILNFYINKIQTSKAAIENKLNENKLRPFEFYLINN